MRDNPTLDPGSLAALEAAMEAAAQGGNAGTGEGAGTGSETGAASGQWPGDTQGSSPGNAGAGTGPLTPAEQVAILDARLEAGAGDFDTMILEEQARQRSAPPANTARYPAPDDIPSGNDDDVVARQLREAAMREPDPAVREKLWDEYRKYKGLTP